MVMAFILGINPILHICPELRNPNLGIRMISPLWVSMVLAILDKIEGREQGVKEVLVVQS